MNLSGISTRLRELDRQSKLEKLLAPVDETLPWAEILNVLHWPAMIGIAIHVCCMALVAKEQPPSRGDIGWLALLVFVAIVLKFGSPLARTRMQRLRRQLRRRGLVVPAAIVQANHAFHAPDNKQWLPASLLVAFDPAVLQRPEALAGAAERLFALKGADRRTLPPDHVPIAWSLYHEMGPVASVPVPPELVDGLRDCVLASVMLPPQPLRSTDLLLCLGLSGQPSPHAIAVIPQSAIA